MTTSLERRFLNDDTLWDDDAFRHIGETYGVDLAQTAQTWYRDRDLYGDLDRRIDQIETSLPRIDDDLREHVYDHPLVDHLYTIVKQYGPTPVEDGTSASHYYEQFQTDERLGNAFILDENVIHDMFVCRARRHVDWIDTTDIPAYNALMDDLPVEREHDYPWHAGFALLDTALSQPGAEIYIPRRPRTGIVAAYGLGRTQEIYDALFELGNPIRVEQPAENPALDALREDPTIAEHAETLNATIITNDHDFLDLQEWYNITALPPDLATLLLHQH